MKVEKALENVAIPIAVNWSHSHILLALRLLAIDLFSSIKTDINQMVNAQFGTLFRPGSSSDEFTPSRVPTMPCTWSAAEKRTFEEQFGPKLYESVEELVGHFDNIPDTSARALEAFAYLEKVVHLCLGPEMVYPFMQQCLSEPAQKA